MKRRRYIDDGSLPLFDVRAVVWLAAIGFLGVNPSTAHAQTWLGSVSQDWTVGGNWVGGVAPSGGTITINTLTPNSTLASGVTFAPSVSSAIRIATPAGTEGLLTLSNGSVFNVLAGQISVGESGRGSLQIFDLQLSTTQSISIGSYGVGVVEVSGPTASLSTTNSILNVGAFSGGNGALNISNGATVNARNVTLGNLQGSGSIVVEGPGSQLNISDITNGDLSVAGLSGDTSVLVRNGGHISIAGPTGLLELASNTPSVTTFTLTGTGSAITSSGIAYIGEFGIVRASVLDHAVLTTGSDLNIGRFDDPVGQPNGQLTVDGGGRVNVAGQTIIGDEGIGVLTIAGSSQVTGPGGVVIARSATSIGTLNIGAPVGAPAVAPGILDTGNITFGTGVGTIVFNHTDSGYIFSQSISGAGIVDVLSGTTILTGTSGLTGPTNVMGGALVVEGSIANSAVTAMAGATLGGNGTVGSVLAQSGSILSPGHNGIGSLTVNGAYTQAAGSIYQVQVDPNSSASDRIAVSGAANLANGAVLNVTKTSAAPYVPGTKYTVLTTTGGLTGTFNVIGETAVTPFINLFGTYDANNAYLQAAQTRSLASVGGTPNQTATADALDSLPLTAPLLTALLNVPSDDAARHAFDQLSGEVHASVQTTLIDDSRYLRQAVLGRLRQGSYGAGAGSMAALGSGGPTVAYAKSELGFGDRFAPAKSALAYADTRKRAFPVKALPLAVTAQAPEIAWWAQGVGAWGKFNGDGNAADVSRNLAGFFTGVDRRFGDNWRAGFASGYTNSSVRIGERASLANIDTVHLAAYAGANFGPWNLRSGAAFSWSTVGTNRSILFPGFFDSTTARYDASTAQIFGEVGYGIALGTIAAEPFAGLAWVHLNSHSFRETGGAAALSGSGNTDDVGYSTLGARAATNYLLPNEMVLRPRVTAAWQHAFGTLDPATALTFQGAGAAFSIAGVPLARDALLVETGLDLEINPRATVGISYVGQLANSAHDQSVKGNFTWKF